MLGLSARPVVEKVIAPTVRGLARAGVTPDLITVVGTVAAVAVVHVIVVGVCAGVVVHVPSLARAAFRTTPPTRRERAKPYAAWHDE